MLARPDFAGSPLLTMTARGGVILLTAHAGDDHSPPAVHSRRENTRSFTVSRTIVVDMDLPYWPIHIILDILSMAQFPIQDCRKLFLTKPTRPVQSPQQGTGSGSFHENRKNFYSTAGDFCWRVHRFGKDPGRSAGSAISGTEK